MEHPWKIDVLTRVPIDAMKMQILRANPFGCKRDRQIDGERGEGKRGSGWQV